MIGMANSINTQLRQNKSPLKNCLTFEYRIHKTKSESEMFIILLNFAKSSLDDFLQRNISFQN